MSLEDSIEQVSSCIKNMNLSQKQEILLLANVLFSRIDKFYELDSSFDVDTKFKHRLDISDFNSIEVLRDTYPESISLELLYLAHNLVHLSNVIEQKELINYGSTTRE